VPFCEICLLILQIDITDVGTEFNIWSVFGEFHDVPDVHVSNKDVIMSVNDPRHSSFGYRLLMPSSVHGMFIHGCSSLLWCCCGFMLYVVLCHFYVNTDTYSSCLSIKNI